MSTEAPKPSRTPWIIAGVLGCLVLCLLGAVVGGGLAVLSGTFPIGGATPVIRAVPTEPRVVVPTLPQVIQPTMPLGQPTLPPLQPPGQPTLPPIQPTQPSPVQPTLPLVQPPQPPPAAPKARLAFTVRRGDRPEDNYVWTMNADGSGAKEVLKRASEPTFSPDGNKIAFYQWTDGIFVANTDGTEPKKILGESNAGYMSWSHDGRWIAFSVRPGKSGNIATDAIAPDGTARHPVTIGWSPSWSPDDTMVVFQTCRGSACGIYKANSAGGDAIPIIADDGGLAAWSPDGSKILYQKDEGGSKQLFVINPDGSGKKQLTTGPAMHVSANWSPDGNFIFYRSPEGGQWGIWRMNADGSNPVKIANDMPPGDWPYDRIAVTK